MILSPLFSFVRERHVFNAFIPDIPGNRDMVILSGGLRYRHLSEMRGAFCLIPGPVFVRWIEHAASATPVDTGYEEAFFWKGVTRRGSGRFARSRHGEVPDGTERPESLPGESSVSQFAL